MATKATPWWKSGTPAPAPGWVQAAKNGLQPFGIRVLHTIGTQTRISGLGSYDEVLLLEGNTFAHKEAIKAVGGRWSAYQKAWVVTKAQAAALAARLAK